MIRSELVQNLADKNMGLAQCDINKMVAVFFNAISAALAENNRVEIRGFGTFSTRPREARTGRNPRTGEIIAVESKRIPHFKPGRDLMLRING